MPSLSDLWGLIRKPDRMLELEEKPGRASIAMQAQIDALAERVGRLQVCEEIFVAKAEAAAGQVVLTFRAQAC